MLSKKPEEVSWDDLREYIFYLMDVKKISPRTINGHISQLRYFYLYVLRKEWDPYQVPFQKFDTAVRKALTQHEVSEFINSFGNLKQKAVISLMYSSGLRVSEVCRLEYGDVSRKDMTITIKQGKNRSGSIAILSRKALDILTEYWRISGRPREGWLFPGQNGGTHITPETVRRYIKNQISSLGWETNISCHCFRRAFGTHLYQNGVDILVIKHLMRHKSLKSTVAYIYLGTVGKDKLISPFDTYPGPQA
jgi:site-specific recombinase XerD